jgi:hypothetical protein
MSVSCRAWWRTSTATASCSTLLSPTSLRPFLPCLSCFVSLAQHALSHLLYTPCPTCSTRLVSLALYLDSLVQHALTHLLYTPHPTCTIRRLVVYHDLLLTSKPYLHCVTAVQPRWLAAACPALYTFLPPANAMRLSKRERRLGERGEEGRWEGGRAREARGGDSDGSGRGGDSDSDWHLGSSGHPGEREELVGGAGRGEGEREGMRAMGRIRDASFSDVGEYSGRAASRDGGGGESGAKMSAVQAAFLGIKRGKGRRDGG